MEFKPCQTIVASDRENGSESSLQAFITTLSSRYILLKELAIGMQLSFKQRGHFKHARTLCKAFPDALLFSERVRHERSVRKRKKENSPKAITDTNSHAEPSPGPNARQNSNCLNYAPAEDFGWIILNDPLKVFR